MKAGLPRCTLTQPTLVKQPFHRQGWIYEEKVYGWRILVYKDGARVRLASRTGVDYARRFRDVASAMAALPVPTLVLDRRGGDLRRVAPLPLRLAPLHTRRGGYASDLHRVRRPVPRRRGPHESPG